MKHVTILGIDGAGKSTIVQKIIKESKLDPSLVAVVNSPAFHEGKDAPFKDLSQELEHLSQAADEIGSFELKGMALYLQVSLFGVVEKTFREYWVPRLLISQRHPVLDSLVYGDLYQQMIQGPLNRDTIEPQLKAKLATRGASWERIHHWYERQAARLGLNMDFWTFPTHLKKTFAQNHDALMWDLKRHYQASLPEAVILIDINPAVAMGRVDSRSQEQKELHENLPLMLKLRDGYHQLMQKLSHDHKEIQQMTVDGQSGDALAQIEAFLPALLK